MVINFSTSPGFFFWKPSAWLRVSGADAFAFLQGQFSNDLRALATADGEKGVYGLWLTLKGKVMADSFVLRDGAADGFWVGSYESPAAIIRDRLESFIIADDVSVEDQTEQWHGASDMGIGESPWPAPVEGEERVNFRGRRTDGGNFEWMYRPPALERAEEMLGRADVSGTLGWSQAQIEYARIAGAVPSVPRDIGPGDLPNEGGLDESSISYTKGCYLGQEVMARLKSMGQVRRKLVRVCGSAPAVTAGTALWQGGRTIGEIRTVAMHPERPEFLAFAMVTRMHVIAGAPLAAGSDDGGAVELIDTP